MFYNLKVCVAVVIKFRSFFLIQHLLSEFMFYESKLLTFMGEFRRDPEKLLLAYMNFIP